MQVAQSDVEAARHIIHMASRVDHDKEYCTAFHFSQKKKPETATAAWQHCHVAALARSSSFTPGTQPAGSWSTLKMLQLVQKYLLQAVASRVPSLENGL